MTHKNCIDVPRRKPNTVLRIEILLKSMTRHMTLLVVCKNRYGGKTDPSCGSGADELFLEQIIKDILSGVVLAPWFDVLGNAYDGISGRN